MNKVYAGIGARKTPPEILHLMSRIATRLGELGYTLRSGGAAGADQAFLEGALRSGGAVELYLPKEGYRGHTAERYGKRVAVSASIPQRAFTLAMQHHPAWGRLSAFVKKLHARNAQILAGGDAESAPAKFVIAWTPRGEEVGGTGMSIKMARALGIPVINLYEAGAVKEIARLVKE